MTAVTLREIDERLRQLPPEKLIVVYDFISYLIERDSGSLLAPSDHARDSAIAAEPTLRRDWDQLEEDAAWAHL